MAGGCQPHRGALTWGHHEVHEAREAHEASCHDQTVAHHPSRSQAAGQTGAARSGPGGTARACREVVCHTGSGLGGSTRRAAQGDGEELYAGQAQHAWALATNLRVANSLGVLLLQLLRRLRVARPPGQHQHEHDTSPCPVHGHQRHGAYPRCCCGPPFLLRSACLRLFCLLLGVGIGLGFFQLWAWTTTQPQARARVVSMWKRLQRCRGRISARNRGWTYHPNATCAVVVKFAGSLQLLQLTELHKSPRPLVLPLVACNVNGRPPRDCTHLVLNQRQPLLLQHLVPHIHAVLLVFRFFLRHGATLVSPCWDLARACHCMTHLLALLLAKLVRGVQGALLALAHADRPAPSPAHHHAPVLAANVAQNRNYNRVAAE